MPTTQIFVEKRGIIKSRNRFTVNCPNHGDLLKTWSEPEAIALGILHEATNHPTETI